MVNDLIKGALLGVFGYFWYWLATAAPYIGPNDDVGSGYIFFTIVAAALLAGK